MGPIVLSLNKKKHVNNNRRQIQVRDKISNDFKSVQIEDSIPNTNGEENAAELKVGDGVEI
jgi:hypothetical protein